MAPEDFQDTVFLEKLLNRYQDEISALSLRLDSLRQRFELSERRSSTQKQPIEINQRYPYADFPEYSRPSCMGVLLTSLIILFLATFFPIEQIWPFLLIIIILIIAFYIYPYSKKKYQPAKGEPLNKIIESQKQDEDTLSTFFSIEKASKKNYSQLGSRTQPNVQAQEIANLTKLVLDLRSALEETRKELKQLIEGKVTSSKTIAAKISLDNCEHWHELITTHIKSIRILELKQAREGGDFHYSKQIELEERRERVAELQRDIDQNCSD